MHFHAASSFIRLSVACLTEKNIQEISSTGIPYSKSQNYNYRREHLTRSQNLPNRMTQPIKGKQLL